MIKFLKRIRVLQEEDGRVFHFGDGKDFIKVKSFRSCHEAREYGSYLESIGFNDIRVSFDEVFRYKCETGGVDMMWTNIMNGGS